MKTVQKVLIAVLSVAFVVSAVAAGFSFFVGKSNIDNIRLLPDAVTKGESIDSVCTASLTTEYPIVRSDFSDIFYCVRPEGTVEFYEFNENGLSLYSGEVNTIDLAPSCTYYKIPITVYYIEHNSKTLGYGLFTTENSASEVNLYSYVFAKLVDAPSVYGVDGKLLLLSTDSEQAYSINKVYTEAFEVNMKTQKCRSFTAQRDRTADRNGRFAERWSVFTDGYFASASKRACMVSGRLYGENTLVYDVYDLNKGLNKPMVKEIYSTFLREDSDSGLVYLKKSEDGFRSVQYIAEEKTVAEFRGDIACDFLFSGDWVYDLKKSEFTNLVSGKTVDGKKLDGSIQAFCVNGDGSKIAAVTTDSEARLLCILTPDGEVKKYTGENVFSPAVDNMCFVNSSTLLTTDVTSDEKCVNYIITVE